MSAAGPPKDANPPAASVPRKPQRSGSPPKPLQIGAAPLRIEDVADVAKTGRPIALAPDVQARIAAARAVVLRLAQTDASIYGVNSALGANTGQRLADTDLADYQSRAIRARAVGIGAPLDGASVRATMLARIAGMAAGGSGVSQPVLEALVAMLNRGVHPVVPRLGSIGVADLPQLSHLALPLIGEGEAEFEGTLLPGAEALRRAGIAPVTLGPQDGLALISAHAATVGRAALVSDDALRIAAARPAPRQIDVARELRKLLAGSALFEPGAARRVQDPLSFRVVAQVQGSLQAALANAREQIEVELNSAAESPLVLADAGVMLSNGNFHLPALALAFDAAAIAFAQSASLATERVIRFMSPAFTGLPLQLTRHGPAHSGFATLQKTLTALWSAIRLRANPASLDFLPVSEGAEDHATMAPGTVEKLAEMLERVRYVVAIELVVAAQAIDLRSLDVNALGHGARIAYARIREHVAALDGDRPLGPDVDAIAGRVADDAFSAIEGLP